MSWPGGLAWFVTARGHHSMKDESWSSLLMLSCTCLQAVHARSRHIQDGGVSESQQPPCQCPCLQLEPPAPPCPPPKCATRPRAVQVSLHQALLVKDDTANVQSAMIDGATTSWQAVASKGRTGYEPAQSNHKHVESDAAALCVTQC